MKPKDKKRKEKKRRKEKKKEKKRKKDETSLQRPLFAFLLLFSSISISKICSLRGP